MNAFLQLDGLVSVGIPLLVVEYQDVVIIDEVGDDVEIEEFGKLPHDRVIPVDFPILWILEIVGEKGQSAVNVEVVVDFELDSRDELGSNCEIDRAVILAGDEILPCLVFLIRELLRILVLIPPGHAIVLPQPRMK